MYKSIYVKVKLQDKITFKGLRQELTLLRLITIFT